LRNIEPARQVCLRRRAIGKRLAGFLALVTGKGSGALAKLYLLQVADYKKSRISIIRTITRKLMRRKFAASVP